MRNPDKATSDVRIVPATVAEKPVLANLLELYCHDFCDFVTLTIGTDGRFGYDDLDLYWTRPEFHYPFLVYAGVRLAGFALVDAIDRESPAKPVWDIAEFFILRGFRRTGLGSEAARQIWSRFPGSWEVRVLVANEPAYRFWDRAVHLFAGQEVKVTRVIYGGRERHLFSFESRPPAQEADVATEPTG